jgi:hypothetical protein
MKHKVKRVHFVEIKERNASRRCLWPRCSYADFVAVS